MTWYICPNCASRQDPDIQSVWNDKDNKRIGLEVYAADIEGKGQKGLTLITCQVHRRVSAPTPIQDEAQLEELRKFFANTRKPTGGI